MAPCWERGKFASWIAPPKVGIDNKAGDFEYVKVAPGVMYTGPTLAV